MKRWLLRFLVIALVFVLGGYGGMSWSKKFVTQRPDRVYHDAVEVSSRQVIEHQESRFVDSLPSSSAPGIFDGSVRFASNQFSDSEPRAFPVSDRLAVPEPARPQSAAGATPWETVPPSFADSNGFDGAQPVIHSNGPVFQASGNLVGQPPVVPNAIRADKTDVVNLMKGMSYLIRVNRKDQSQSQEIRIQRMYGGKQVVVLDLAEKHSMPDLRIFAETVEVTSVGGDFQLKCEGKVAVVANQSMLWGEGLELKDSAFKISEAEVVTPDAVIKSGSCEFEFAVGGISVDEISGNEEVPAAVGGVVGKEDETAPPPLFDQPAELPVNEAASTTF